MADGSEDQASQDAQRHATKHQFRKMDAKYYENEFVHTAIKELDYVRTPFYDLAQHEHLKEGEDTSKYLEDLSVKT